MEPIKRQLPVDSTGAPTNSSDIGFARIRPVTLDELRPDASTGNYTATKPGVGQVDTKAAVAEIRAGNEDDTRRTAEARKLMTDYADEITQMRANRGRSYKKWAKGYRASQKPSTNKEGK